MAKKDKKDKDNPWLSSEEFQKFHGMTAGVFNQRRHEGIIQKGDNMPLYHKGDTTLVAARKPLYRFKGGIPTEYVFKFTELSKMLGVPVRLFYGHAGNKAKLEELTGLTAHKYTLDSGGIGYRFKKSEIATRPITKCEKNDYVYTLKELSKKLDIPLTHFRGQSSSRLMLEKITGLTAHEYAHGKQTRYRFLKSDIEAKIKERADD